MKTPLISVLIVTWNRKDDVLETLQSVYEQAYQEFEIILVDNGSEDGTVVAVSSFYPNVRIIALEKNIGISAGRNAGIKIAKGEIIFCLDSDANLSNNAFVNLINRFQSDPKLGIINSKIVNAYTKRLDTGPGWAYSEEQKANQNIEFLSWSFSEGGAAIRKEVLDTVGNFWELLFFGCEGQELSLRVWDAGYKVLYYPDSIVYHRASLHQRVSGKERDSLFFKNNLYIYIARYPFWLLILIAPLRIGAVLLRATRRGYLLDVLKVLLNIFKNFPLLLRHRKPIKNHTAFLYLKLQREQGPLSWNLLTWIKLKS